MRMKRVGVQATIITTVIREEEKLHIITNVIKVIVKLNQPLMSMKTKKRPSRMPLKFLNYLRLSRVVMTLLS